MRRFTGISVKRMVPCRCFDGHVKESYEMSMAGSPTVGPTSSVRLHIYAPSHIYNWNIIDCDVKQLIYSTTSISRPGLHNLLGHLSSGHCILYGAHRSNYDKFTRDAVVHFNKFTIHSICFWERIYIICKLDFVKLISVCTGDQ